MNKAVSHLLPIFLLLFFAASFLFCRVRAQKAAQDDEPVLPVQTVKALSDKPETDDGKPAEKPWRLYAENGELFFSGCSGISTPAGIAVPEFLPQTDIDALQEGLFFAEEGELRDYLETLFS